MVPPELRVKRTKSITAKAPVGTAWCAACQSFRDLEDFGKGATQCRACVSSATHTKMVAKTYGLGPGEYAALLEAQGGRCAICRAKPKSKRLAVDHDHKSGAVRGLLCSGCNHDLMGSAWDSMAMAEALWHYMNTPPALGEWLPPGEAAPLSGSLSAVDSAPEGFARPSDGLKPSPRSSVGAVQTLSTSGLSLAEFTLAGGSRDASGQYRIYYRRGDAPPF